LTQHTL